VVACALLTIARGLVVFFKDEELEAVFKAYDRTLMINDTRKNYLFTSSDTVYMQRSISPTGDLK
jgi:hypothetical protein